MPHETVNALFILILLSAAHCSYIQGPYTTTLKPANAQQETNPAGSSISWDSVLPITSASTADSADVTLSASALRSNIITLQNFANTVNATADICGISANVYAYFPVSSIGYTIIVDQVSLTSTSKAAAERFSLSAITATGSTPNRQPIVIGGATDTWGLVWSPSDVSSMILKFAVRINNTHGLIPNQNVAVDGFNMTVYFNFTVTVSAISPSEVFGLAGGPVINITGDNFLVYPPPYNPLCRFGDKTVSGTLVRNVLQCVLPAQTAYGDYAVEVSFNNIAFTNNNVTFRYAKSCPNDCSGFGQCNTLTGICLCDAGRVGDCSQFICTDVNNCTGRGNCSAPNVCTCKTGYLPPSCEDSDCSLLSGCSGHGDCVEPNKCDCETGWGGYACDECAAGYIPPDCFEKYSCPTLNNCNAAGTCIAVDPEEVCQCVAGRLPPDCLYWDCSQVNNCTGNGRCVRQNKCDCFGTWTGADCSQKPKESNNVVAIAASVSGGGAVIIAGIIAGLLIRRRNKGLKLREPNYEVLAFSGVVPYDIPKAAKGALKSLEELLLNSEFKLLDAMLDATATTESDSVAKAIVFIFDSHKACLDMMSHLTSKSVRATEQETTLFRNNTFCTKCVSQYLRIHGMRYLWTTLGRQVNELSASASSSEDDQEGTALNSIFSPGSLEIDPSKVEDQDVVAVNKFQLAFVAQKMLLVILKSAKDMPSEYRDYLRSVKVQVANKFPESDYKAIGAFVFLRFICAALVVPHVYGLLSDPPGQSCMRYLTLLSKIFTNLVNNSSNKKEAYMDQMSGFISDNQDRLMKFYDELLDIDGTNVEGNTAVPENVKENSLALLHSHLIVIKSKLQLDESTASALDAALQQYPETIKKA